MVKCLEQEEASSMSPQVYRSLSTVNRASELPCLANQQGIALPCETVSSFEPLHLGQPEEGCHASGEGQAQVIFK